MIFSACLYVCVTKLQMFCVCVRACVCVCVWEREGEREGDLEQRIATAAANVDEEMLRCVCKELDYRIGIVVWQKAYT
jgi:hypothetical protein